MARSITTQYLVQQLRDLGIHFGDVLLVHTSLSAIGPVDGGPQGFIQALQCALGSTGTLVMPSMSVDDIHTFDPATTECAWLGVTANTFWRLPGVSRGNSPHSFAAIGRHAAILTRPQPWDLPHGTQTPVGWLAALDAKVLLAGVAHSSNSTIHLAEFLAGVPYRTSTSLTILQAGKPVAVNYGEINHCCRRFDQMDGWMDQAGWQTKGSLGNGLGRLMRSRHILQAAIPRLRADPFLFLHPVGVDEECDAARASLPA